MQQTIHGRKLSFSVYQDGRLFQASILPNQIIMKYQDFMTGEKLSRIVKRVRT